MADDEVNYPLAEHRERLVRFVRVRRLRTLMRELFDDSEEAKV
jgi:hypothetical protein